MSNHSEVIIITGAGRGIGRACALKLAKTGATVVVNYQASQGPAEQVVADIAAVGGKARAIHGDVAREDDVLRFFDTAAALGPITGLVNNAGVVRDIGPLATANASQIERMLAVNTLGSILCAREAVRHMSTSQGGQGGVIVNISSAAARTGGAGEWVDYAASKGAIDTFTVGLAREVANQGIRVNAVRPGLIATDIHESAGDPGRLDRLRSVIPMAREGTADEVADAIVWLMSEQAAYVTGTILDVTGGR